MAGRIGAGGSVERQMQARLGQIENAVGSTALKKSLMNINANKGKNLAQGGRSSDRADAPKDFVTDTEKEALALNSQVQRDMRKNRYGVNWRLDRGNEKLAADGKQVISFSMEMQKALQELLARSETIAQEVQNDEELLAKFQLQKDILDTELRIVKRRVGKRKMSIEQYDKCLIECHIALRKIDDTEALLSTACRRKTSLADKAKARGMDMADDDSDLDEGERFKADKEQLKKARSFDKMGKTAMGEEIANEKLSLAHTNLTEALPAYYAESADLARAHQAEKEGAKRRKSVTIVE